MTCIKVKKKYQITIPAMVRKLIDLHEGDILEAKVENGYIILVPQVVSDKNHKTASSLLSMIGANKGSGLYKSAQDIDQAIAKQRSEWN